MPTFAVLLLVLFVSALAASAASLVEFFIQAWAAGHLAHYPSQYLSSVVATTLENAFIAAVILGAPLYMILYRLGWLRWWSSILTGFIVGAIPAGVLFWPMHRTYGNVVTITEVRDGRQVQTIVNGVPTLAGWLEFAQHVLTYAAAGAVGGLVFWLMWRRVQPLLAQLPARR
jgi:hypothetical protein